MRPNPRNLVAMVLHEPARLLQLSLPEWDLLVRQARSADLLARITALLDNRALLDRVPAGPRMALIAARTLATAQHDEVRREVVHIAETLRSLAVPLVLLKGAAYLLCGLPAALGRTFSDVDVLVPRNRLAEVEAALMLAGWATTHHSEYDQRYYRTWMHELPPLQHIRRQTLLDVHHAILPPTARLKPDSRKLFEAAQPVQGVAAVHVLAPVDMVLHSITHLFHNDDLRHGLRDLSDLDLLLRHFGRATGFWDELVERAKELDLLRPLYYGLRYSHRILGTPLPSATLRASRRIAPPWPLRMVMDWLWARALQPPHPQTGGTLIEVCLFALYLRAHWLRMPPLLLARHIMIKASTRMAGRQGPGA